MTPEAQNYLRDSVAAEHEAVMAASREMAKLRQPAPLQPLSRTEAIIKFLKEHDRAHGVELLPVLTLTDGRRLPIWKLDVLEAGAIKLTAALEHMEQPPTSAEFLISEDAIAGVEYVNRFTPYIGYERLPAQIPLRPKKDQEQPQRVDVDIQLPEPVAKADPVPPAPPPQITLNVQPTPVNITVNPEIKIPPMSEKSTILRDNAGRITGSRTEIVPEG